MFSDGLLSSQPSTWTSERSSLWTATEGAVLMQVPCILTIDSDGLESKRWFPLSVIFFPIGGLIMALTKKSNLTLPSANISNIVINKTWIDNPIARGRVESNAKMKYKMHVETTEGNKKTFRVFLRKDDLDHFQTIDWLREKVAVA